ncbi:hypothetical protein ACFPM0_05755 [Pseudonocardia sulfidoxydans]
MARRPRRPERASAALNIPSARTCRRIVAASTPNRPLPCSGSVQ